MRILGIESSCDETSVAVCEDGKILSNVIATQEKHKLYGGVVPELASRMHLENIIEVVDLALERGGILLSEVDGFAFTQKPGLLGSLLVGACFVKSLALSEGKPLIGVNHIDAHVCANMIGRRNPKFPFMCLTVSGGHTQIVLCEGRNQYKVVGKTLDDAAGEAFDKSAKILGLSYPGGVLIDKLGNQGKARFVFPEPQVGGFDYSFSGLKTAILYFVKEETEKNKNFISNNLQDICASVQASIVRILLNKFFKAVDFYDIQEVCLAGGVAANSLLRKLFWEVCGDRGYAGYVPDFEYCTDNAGMIAIQGYYQFLEGDFVGLDVVPSASV